MVIIFLTGVEFWLSPRTWRYYSRRSRDFVAMSPDGLQHLFLLSISYLLPFPRGKRQTRSAKSYNCGFSKYYTTLYFKSSLSLI